jgi:hypothetical protein
MGYVLTTDEICVYRPDEPPQDTVKRIKERVEEKEGIPPPQQRLIFGGKQMHDDKSASDYNRETSIPHSFHDSISHHVLCHSSTFHLLVKLCPFHCLSMPFARLSFLPSLHLVFPRNEQPHLFGCKQHLTSDCSPLPLSVEGGSTLHLVLALRGGSA